MWAGVEAFKASLPASFCLYSRLIQIYYLTAGQSRHPELEYLNTVVELV